METLKVLNHDSTVIFSFDATMGSPDIPFRYSQFVAHVVEKLSCCGKFEIKDRHVSKDREPILEAHDCCAGEGKVTSKGKMSKSIAKTEKTLVHPDHSAKIKRINRIVGQLEGVKRMIEAQRYCVDILTQTRAIISATKALEGAILKTHMKQCVSKSLKVNDNSDFSKKITEIVELFERY